MEGKKLTELKNQIGFSWYSLKQKFKNLTRYMVPIKGDINFHKEIANSLTDSKLERILADVYFCTFKYIAYWGLASSIYNIIHQKNSHV